MAFKATNIVPQVAYQTVKQAAAQLKINLDGIVAQTAATGADYELLRATYQTLVRARNQLTDMRTTPGLGDYAKAQEGSETYDIAAEFTTMIGAIDAAITWLDTNIPKNVTLKPVNEWIGGSFVSTSFSPAQTGSLRAVLSAVSATIL